MDSLLIGELAAVGAAFCWAVAPLFYRQALFKAKPMAANIVRCSTNAVVMLIILFALGKWGTLASLPLNVMVIVVVSGIIGLGIGDTLYLYGLKTVGVSRAVPLSATYPLFTLIWATLLLGEPVTVTAVAGAVVILAGIWLLSREKTDSGDREKGQLVLTGLVASLATAIIWSVSLSLMDIVVKMPGVGTLDANYAIITLRIASIAGFLLLLSPLLERERSFLKVSRSTAIGLCVGGLIANTLGWLLMNYSFTATVSTQAVPISSITPLFSAFAGFLLFREKATLSRVLGVVVVVIGVVLIFIV
jgi:drug/metabolite transporter, DME family